MNLERSPKTLICIGNQRKIDIATVSNYIIFKKPYLSTVKTKIININLALVIPTTSAGIKKMTPPKSINSNTMKYLFFYISILFTVNTFGQSDQQFVIDGAISLSNSNTDTPVEGTLRWNSTAKKFQGYDGSKWLNFGNTGSPLTGNWGTSGPFTYEDKIILSPTPTHNVSFAQVLSCEGDYTAITDRYLGNRVIRLYEGDEVKKTITRNDTDGRFVPRNYDISNDLLVMSDSVTFVYNIRTDETKLLKSDSVFVADDPGYGFAYDGNHIIPTTTSRFLSHFYQLPNGEWEDRGVIWDKSIAANQSLSGDVLAFNIPTGIQIMEFSNNQWNDDKLIEVPSGFIVADLDVQGDHLAIVFSAFSSTDQLESVGTINIYDRKNNWDLAQSITNPDLGYIFGQVAIQGNTVIAHTELITDEDQSLYNGQGKIHVYEFDNTNWERTAILTSSDGRAFDWFGWGAFPRINNIDLTDDRIVIGTRNADIIPNNPNNADHGKAYVFYRK